MSVLDIFKVSLTALSQNKVRSGLTMLGIIIGVFSVITLISLGQGAKRYIENQFAGIGTNLILIVPGKSDTRGGSHPVWGASNVRKLTIDDAKAMERMVTTIDGAVPVIFGLSLVKYKNSSRNTNIIGVDEEFEKVRNIFVEIGSFFSADDVAASRRVCTLGRKVKKELFGEGDALGQYIKIGESKFRVIGIMERKGQSLGFDLDDVVFIPVTAASKLFNTDGLFEIIAKGALNVSIETAQEDIRAVLKKRHNNNEDFTIINQTQLLETLETILNMLTIMLGGIASISLVVGGIGIMNIMFVTVKERTREIGIRKAVGAKKRDILMQFIVEAVALSVTGGAIGILIAIIAEYAASAAIEEMPSIITPWSVILAFSFAAATGIFFGVYPAWKASLLHPIQALRHE